MKDYLKLLGGLVVAVMSVGILLTVANVMGFANFAFFAPKVEQVRFDTFKQSQAYNDGMLRDLQNLKLEYLKGDADQKAALRGIVLQRFSVYDATKLPPDLQAFYNSLKGARQ